MQSPEKEEDSPGSNEFISKTDRKGKIILQKK